MKKLIIPAMLFVALLCMLLFSCGKATNTTEACRHEAMMNLDKGNYDAVLASTCADAMQIGAAWFGKAGFDMTNVINQFIEANSSTQKSDLNIYMTSLVGDVTSDTLTNLDNARQLYSQVSTTTFGDSSYKDAQFYISLVDAVKTLSVIKSVIPDSLNPDGTLNTSCDQNNNGVPDDADATACVLMTNAGQACSGAVVSSTTGTAMPLQLYSSATGTLSGQYQGLVIAIDNVQGGSTTSCPNPNEYKRLLFYQDPLWVTATISDQTCQEVSPGTTSTWPCPLESNNVPVDLVATIETALNSAVDALATAITGTTGTDVQQAIQDIKAQACGGNDICTEQEIADYLQNYLK